MTDRKTAILIGNSDGIGLATTRRLVDCGYEVIGISRSESPYSDPNYKHVVKNVCEADYEDCLRAVIKNLEMVDLCIYCAGIGELLRFDKLDHEVATYEVNVMAAVKTTSIVLDLMLTQKEGHFIGLSSIADVFTSGEAPSYSGSKAGISRYWEGMGLAMKPKNVHVTNVRFGFVDTKMAKGEFKPFLMPVEKAVDHIMSVIKKPRIRLTRPRIAIPMARLMAIPNQIKILFS